MGNIKVISLILIFTFSISFFGYPLSIVDAQKDYLYGNYDQAIAKALKLSDSDEVVYFLGLAYMKTANYPKARLYFRKVIRRYSKSKFYDLSMVKLADTYFFEKDYSQARALYLEIEERDPNCNTMPLVFLRLAQIASRQGAWSEKGKYLRKIKNKYPKSSEMEFVRVLEELGDFFTIQVGAFSVRANALLLVDELSARGGSTLGGEDEYSSYIVKEKKGSYLLYKVRVGKFRKRYDAEKAFSNLLDKGYPAKIYP